MAGILRVDPARKQRDDTTGIYVRAMDGEKPVSIDIACLTRESLIEWLADAPGRAMGTVLAILDHKYQAEGNNG